MSSKLKTPSKQHWKFTKDTSEKPERKKYRNDIVHQPAEIQFQPYKYKPTAVEKWLGYPIEETEDGM